MVAVFCSPTVQAAKDKRLEVSADERRLFVTLGNGQLLGKVDQDLRLARIEVIGEWRQVTFFQVI